MTDPGKLLKNPPARANSHHRMNQFQRRKEFYSVKFRCSRDTKIKALARECVKILRKDHFTNDLKAPFGSNCKPAMMSKPSVNYYFGQNTHESENEGTVTRATHAVGSGTQSIGLDPRTNQLRPFFPELTDLMRCVTKSVRGKTCSKNAHFNFVSVKLHYTFHDEDGEPVEKDMKWHH